MIFIGVDPGLKGAIASLSDCDDECRVWDMPTMPWGKSGKRAVSLVDVRVRVIGSLNVNRGTAFIERVSAMPKQGVVSMFSLGMSMYGVAGVFEGAMWPVQFVESRTWKKFFGLDANKANSLALARELFPWADLRLKKHDGRAEALLIARYAQETYGPHL